MPLFGGWGSKITHAENVGDKTNLLLGYDFFVSGKSNNPFEATISRPNK